MSRRRGFTIWQLLAVLAIIFVIVAFLFPIFARSRGNKDWCPSNEKQLGLAMIQYAQDNNELFPSGSQGGGKGWGGQIFPYVKSTGVYRCPDDLTKSAAQRAVVSYGLNRNIALHPFLGDYTNPASTIQLFEVAGVAADVTQTDEGKSQGATAFSAAADGTDGNLVAGHAPQAAYATGDIGNRPARQPTQFGDARHQEGANYLLADGHVHFFVPCSGLQRSECGIGGRGADGNGVRPRCRDGERGLRGDVQREVRKPPASIMRSGGPTISYL